MSAPTATRPAPAPPNPAAAPSPWRSELRRGLAPWAGAAVLVTLAVTMGTKAAEWQGDWAQTHGLLRWTTMLLLGPLVAAAGCRQGGREHRRGTGDLLRQAVRGRRARTLAALAPVAACVVAAQLLGTAGVYLATWPYSLGGGLTWGHGLLHVADAVSVAGLTAAGFVVGRVVTWRGTALVLALGCYLLLGVSAYVDTPLGRLAPAQEPGVSERIPALWLAPVIAVWVGGLALAALVGHLARQRLLALVPLLAAALAGTVLVQTGDDAWRTDPRAQRLVCDDGTPRICVTERHRNLLAPAGEALSGLREQLAGAPGLPERFVEERRGHRVRRNSGEVPLPSFTPLGRTVVRGEVADEAVFTWETVAGLISPDCPDPSGGALEDVVWTYLAPAHRRNLSDPEDALRRAERYRGAEGVAETRTALEKLDRLRALPEAERAAWLGAYLAAAQRCDFAAQPAL
ncbi:Hypothetical protein B591_08540 [Streptomyces sp. GBA 94-10 4N24]|uniref:hypothetical protein n=1 Tax=Streptomyces sp. GBA 94-10 4N24 TaxID=1218177 RepID=UPI0003C2C0E0|nr:hypothetical protein [Streptomyces sp. GBA 94-10 4N24]ESP99752.1 Hypothetical protein B591_08540 [Streptomyces sp. GBA 94-10 4N24]UZN58707.1 Hypothetical protein B591N_08540 [Streptomyces sp. GBA 94-10 4N24]